MIVFSFASSILQNDWKDNNSDELLRSLIMHTNLCAFVQPNSKFDSIHPDAGALKAGFGDEPQELAFGISAPHQAPEDSK
jgi:hypothetical protein